MLDLETSSDVVLSILIGKTREMIDTEKYKHTVDDIMVCYKYNEI